MGGRIKIEGDQGSNLINGGGGDEEIRGRRGNDTLNGADGDDRLRGDKGDDVLSGGDGRDRLRGDAGNDTLTGGADDDRFQFKLQGGNDVVTDFQNGADRLDVTDFGFATAQDVIDQAAQVGADVVITLDDGVTVTLQNTALAALDASDFLI
jgi:Ca2+-binding RTX toxin-like protein